MYYPKSKIQTNLYTNGYELAYLSTLDNYVGFYYKTYDGKYFSGKSNPTSSQRKKALTTLV